MKGRVFEALRIRRSIKGFSIVEVALAVAILSLVIIFVIGMYTRLLNSNVHNTNRLTAMVIAQTTLEKFAHAFSGNVSDDEAVSLADLIAELETKSEVKGALLVSVNANDMRDYSSFKTVSGSLSDKNQATTYLLAFKLEKISETDQSYLVRATVNVFWWWGTITNSSINISTSPISLSELELANILNSASPNDDLLFSPENVSTSDRFASGRRTYVQLVRYFYVPKET